jgi:hypothetical protein
MTTGSQRVDQEGDAGQQRAGDLAALLDRYHKLAQKRQNPVYAWLALQAIFWARSPTEERFTQDLVIPAWIANYLQDITRDLLDLSAGIDPRIEPELVAMNYDSNEEAMSSPEFKAYTDRRRIGPTDAMDLVPNALGLRRSDEKWNAFADFQSKTSKVHEAHAYNNMKARGISAKTAIHAIGEGIGVKDASSINSRIREGKALIDSLDSDESKD